MLDLFLLARKPLPPASAIPPTLRLQWVLALTFSYSFLISRSQPSNIARGPVFGAKTASQSLPPGLLFGSDLEHQIFLKMNTAPQREPHSGLRGASKISIFLLQNLIQNACVSKHPLQLRFFTVFTPNITIFRHQIPPFSNHPGRHVFDLFCIIPAATLIHRLGMPFRSQLAPKNLSKKLLTRPGGPLLDPKLPPKAFLRDSFSGLHFGYLIFCKITRRLSGSLVLAWAALPTISCFRS